MGPGGFLGPVESLHAALPTPVSAGSGPKGLSQPPLAVQEKDTLAGLHRKLYEGAATAYVVRAAVWQSVLRA
jgi:hypothetical protein